MQGASQVPEATVRIPPGPKVPSIVSGLIVLTNQKTALRALRKRYGDAFTVKIPVLGTSVVISSPELVKQTFTASPDVLAFGRSSPLGAVLGPGSLFSLDGDEHLRERRLLLPPFHGERMKSYEAIIEEEAHREMATWPEGKPFATVDSFMRITLKSILRAVFGAEGPHLHRLAELLPPFTSLGSKLAMLPWARRDLGPGSPGRRFRRYRRDYDRVVDEMIDETLADPRLDERADTMALLLRAKYDDGESMSRSAIADELLTLLTAGHETTATSLAWGVERLRRHPEVLARLRDEAEGDDNALRMATIYEIQRTRPVIVGTGRLVIADDFQLGEYRVPHGYRIVTSATMIHNDRRFFDEPREFRPDRFVDRKPDTYTWIPFGGGVRRCIGAAFAHMEMDVVLRTLLREFDLAPTTERGERWRSRGVAFGPSKGGRAIVSRRRSATHTPATAKEPDLVAV
jgi:cytochrome P450 family 138